MSVDSENSIADPAALMSGQTVQSVFAATSGQELLRWETANGKRGDFAALDSLLGRLLVRSLGKLEQIVALPTRASDRLLVPEILRLSERERVFVADRFSITAQRGRGAWYLPETGTVIGGYINLPYHFAASERFPMTLVTEDKGKAALDATPDGVLLWSILAGLFETLFLPFTLRGPDAAAGKLAKSPADAAVLWNGIDALQAELGFDLSDAMSPLRPGAGWHLLDAGEQVIAKHRLLSMMGTQVTAEMGARWRARLLLEFIQQYSKKSKSGSATVKRQQVVTKAFQQHLSGCFGGDWLAFLSYLGAAPHPDERVITALPETRLYVRGSETKLAQVAAEQGLPVEEVRLMLGTLWQGQATSPVEERVQTLKHFWVEFDAVHERQASGMRPLWGLVEDMRYLRIDAALGTRGRTDDEDNGFAPYQDRLYQDLLSPDLCADIERLFDSVVLPMYPERIVSDPFPHAHMAGAFGPALTFWHGCALTAWFLCEGPYSRTDMAGLREYHRKHLTELEELGTPVDPALFDELIAGEKRLGKPQPIRRDESVTEIIPGISITMGVESGSRRSGFERLRDIITRHRRAWATQCLEQYLERRWEQDLREVSRRYHIHLNEKGKPPTAKQLAKIGEAVTNSWFGGDLSALTASIGERSPVTPERVRLMPRDPLTLGLAVYRALGGTPPPAAPDGKKGEDARQHWQQMSRRHSSLVSLAQLAPTAVQLQEALGVPPTLKQFGASRFDYLASPLDPDPETAWSIYLRALSKALTEVGRDVPRATGSITAATTAAGLSKSSIEATTPRRVIGSQNTTTNPSGTDLITQKVERPVDTASRPAAEEASPPRKDSFTLHLPPATVSQELEQPKSSQEVEEPGLIKRFLRLFQRR